MRSVGQNRGTLVGMLEEASELIGTTLILISFLEFAIKSSRRRSPKGSSSSHPRSFIQITISDQFVKRTYLIVALSAMGSIAMAWFLVPHLKDLHHRGNPSIWHPSIALFIAGVLALINWSLERKNEKGRPHIPLNGCGCLWA